MTDAAGIRVVAIADADSFVKWSAALLGAVPGLRPHLLLVRTPLAASPEQQRTALTGTGLRPQDVTRIGFAETAGWLEGQRPDVVLLAGRGPFVRLMGRVVDSLRHRPVTVSGLPGMAIPAQRGALDYRRHADLLVLHSHREERAFAELGERIGVSMPTALATLPFARRISAFRRDNRWRKKCRRQTLHKSAIVSSRPYFNIPAAWLRCLATVFAGFALWLVGLLDLTSPIDAVDGSSTGTLVPSKWVLLGAHPKGGATCRRLRRLVSTSRSQSFSSTA